MSFKDIINKYDPLQVIAEIEATTAADVAQSTMASGLRARLESL